MNIDGYSPLHIARALGNNDIADIYLGWGAKNEVKNKNGNSTLDLINYPRTERWGFYFSFNEKCENEELELRNNFSLIIRDLPKEETKSEKVKRDFINKFRDIKRSFSGKIKKLNNNK